MRYSWVHIDNFKALEYEFSAEDQLYQEALDDARQKAPLMNCHAPNGEIRSAETILATCFVGCLTERAVIYWINDYAQFRRQNGIIAHAVEYHQGVDPDQIDIVVDGPNRNATIEIRSSLAKVPNNKRRYTEWFSIVGYYTTENKIREIQKDFYITVIVNSDIKDIPGKINNNERISLQLAAGCDRDYLIKNGIDSNLGNKGAQYKIIKPLINGKQITTVGEEIFRFVT